MSSRSRSPRLVHTPLAMAAPSLREQELSRWPRLIPTPVAIAVSSLPEHDAHRNSAEHSSLSSQQQAQEVTLAGPALLEIALPSPASVARASVADVTAVAAVASPARSLVSPNLGITSAARLQHAVPWTVSRVQYAVPWPVSRARGGFVSIAAVAAAASPMRGRATLPQLRTRPSVAAVSRAPEDIATPSLRSAASGGNVRR